MGQFIPREAMGVRGIVSLDPQFGLKCFCESQAWVGVPGPANFPHPTLVVSSRVESSLSLSMVAIGRAGYKALWGSGLLS